MTLTQADDALPSSPAALRNREPILAHLRAVLPPSGLLLEIASGTGEHAVHCAAALPLLEWQPSEADPDRLAILAARTGAARLANLRPPLLLDATAVAWPIERANAVLAVNMIHIAPPPATTGLLAGTARLLAAGEPLILYGPFREAGRPLAPSNAAFDASLRERDPGWGLRELGAVAEHAAEEGLSLAERHEMPANNLLVVFRRI